jgi:hypothetical protein
MDKDPDPGSPKTYGSDGSGSTTLSLAGLIYLVAFPFKQSLAALQLEHLATGFLILLVGTILSFSGTV